MKPSEALQIAVALLRPAFDGDRSMAKRVAAVRKAIENIKEVEAPDHVVATAVWWITTSLDDPKYFPDEESLREVSPYSKGGEPFIIFAKALHDSH